MQVKIIDPSKDERWDEFVGNHSEGTVFHLSNWARVLQKTYGYVPYYFIVEDSDKKIKAGCPFFLIKSWLTGNRLVCLPFTDSCFPLVTSDEDIGTLLHAALQVGREKKASYIEVRSSPKEGTLKSLHLSIHNYYETFILQLSQGIESIRRSLSPMVIRYAVKRIEKSPVKIRTTESEKDMNQFYELNLSTRRKHGVPSQPYELFKNIWKEIILKKLGILLFAEYHKSPIAGSLFFVYKGTIHYKFNASNADYLKCRPNHLLLWHTIQQSCYNGLKYLDLGRASPDNQGLIRFKRLWGANEIELPYYYWPTVKGITSTEEKDVKYRMITSVMRRMPTTISRVAGKLLYKHLG